MIKKTLHYHDLDGNPRVGEYWFGVSKAELAEWALVESDDFEKKIKDIVATKNRREIIRLFKEIIDMSYGVRHEDGEQFIKDKAELKRFKSTDAYSELFMELATDDRAGAAFIKGVMPKDLADKLPDSIPTNAVVTHVPRPPDYSTMSREELEEMLQKATQKQQDQE